MSGKYIKKIFSKLGYSIIKNNSYGSLKEVVNKHFKHFDHLYNVMIIEQKPTIFDIGSNMGNTIKLFKNKFPQSKIYGFEPIPECYEIIKKKYKENKDIEIYNLAVGEKKEEKIFNIYKRSGQSSFYKKTENTDWYLKSEKQKLKFPIQEREIKVNVISLDDFINEKKIDKIDFLKIDTQGYENFVLQGAKNALTNKIIKAIKLEMNFSNIYKKQNSFYEIEENLYKNNYKLYGITNFGNLNDDINFTIDVIYKLN